MVAVTAVGRARSPQQASSQQRTNERANGPHNRLVSIARRQRPLLMSLRAKRTPLRETDRLADQPLGYERFAGPPLARPLGQAGRRARCLWLSVRTASPASQPIDLPWALTVGQRVQVSEHVDSGLDLCVCVFVEYIYIFI